MENSLTTFYGIDIYISPSGGLFARSIKFQGSFDPDSGRMLDGNFDAVGRTMIQEWVVDNSRAIRKNIKNVLDGKPVTPLEPFDVNT